MVYFIALIMGYFVATNALVEKGVSQSIGARYLNPLLGTLSKLGAFGGWFCVLPTAYFVGSSYGNNFTDGLIFVGISLLGSLMSGFLQIPGINYIFSSLTLFVNVALAITVYNIA
ncbi:hypothetical protein [Candidatus Sororendozoicomonas aggregata]|uniref:hypothetical protein n=1 Tax=Candidatus Sororendozoicomonas aggregata TaxID=3073239 RepID=UPI002ED198EF